MLDGGKNGAGATTILVEEEFCTDKGYATGAERALMSALLFDGVQSYLNSILSSAKEKNVEAVSWINSRDDSYVFSFQSVCEGLGIDPDALRLGIANFVSSHTSDYKRARRNF